MNCVRNRLTLWTPCEDILENYIRLNYAIIILNCKINLNVNPQKILNLWNYAKLRITVDGGTTRWLNWIQGHKCDEHNIQSPELITGDMDSLPKYILDYFKLRNSKIIVTPCQDETDYTKSLKVMKKHCDEKQLKLDTIFVFADTSGRFDHIMANINTLYKAAVFLQDKKIYQIATNSITCLLQRGEHSITIPQSLRSKQEWCALIPIGVPCIITSSGLKWNLNNSRVEFGGMVSTSNTYNGEPVVKVITDNPVIWSMGIEALL